MTDNKTYVKEPEKFSVDYVSGSTKNTACQFHQTYELCFFSEGYRTYMINDTAYDIVPNSMLVIPPCVQHSTFGTAGVTRTVIYFTREYLSEYFSPYLVDTLLCDLSEPICILTHPRDNVLSLVNSIKNGFFQNQKVVTALNFALLLSLFKNAQKLPSKKDNFTNGIVGRVTSYIEKNLSEIVSLSEIATTFHVSLSYLEAVFKKNVGLSLMQYIIKSRINLATKKLTETKESVNKIALDCGFSSSTHFSNTFKKHTGFSPREYKRLYNGK